MINYSYEGLKIDGACGILPVAMYDYAKKSDLVKGWRLFSEFVIITVVVLAAVTVISHTDIAKGWKPLVIPVIFILAPIIAMHHRREDSKDYGLHFNEWKSSLLEVLVILTVVFPLFFLGAYYVVKSNFLEARDYIPKKIPTREEIIARIVYQFFYIALSEEFFFRGYLQLRIHRLLGKRYFIRKIGFSWAAIVTSLIFTAGHLLVSFNVMHVLVFFPSLVFGLLRDRHGNLLGPILFHGLCNICLQCFYIFAIYMKI
jgi:membrane protease YdiL (CAAX protease family)